MDKLKINLIPPEIKEQAKKEAKRSFIVKISAALLGVLILFTAGLLAVIVFQNMALQSLNTQLEEEKAKIAGLKENEAVVFFLKNRIDSINQFSDGHYKQGETYDLISSLIPPGINLVSLQIDKTPTVNLQGDTAATVALNNFFNDLMDSGKNEGKIASVSVESLNRSQSGNIGFNLVITMTGK